ncbi:MAG TPA: putative LPS assembly protein LptD [Bacteroidia bacterium]|nr:putative LPS assembly protein LptD [Bacteroidia bacterium]
MLLFQQFVVGSEADKLGLSVLPDSTVTTDSIQVPLPDSTSIRIDSLNADTSQESDEVIKSKIKYHAKDSIRVNLENEIVYLYGEATVDYEDLHLEADRIVIDMQNKELFAEGTKDSTGLLKGSPNFSQAEQKFRSNSIRYNFQTKKGRINYVITQEGEGYIHGEVVKKDQDNNFFIKNGQYTTCNLDTPHFAIRSNRLKVINKSKIVTGPAYLTLEQIPTPILIPFGFFPNKTGRSSGVIIPAFGESAQRGFYFQNLGYYFGFSDYFDLALTTDLYTKGSYLIDATSSYKKRYKYSGRLQLNYAYTINSEKELPDYSITEDFHINWMHSKDSKTSPNSTFSASVNAGTSNYYRNTISSVSNYLTNTLQSSIAYSYKFPELPMNLSAGITHTQNTITHDIRISAPDFSFNVSRITPFKRKNAIGAQKWYEKIGTSLSLNTINYIETKDSLLFTESSIDNLKNGAKAFVPISTSFNLLKYINFSPSANFTERFYLRTTQYEWNTTTNSVDTFEVEKPQQAFEYNLSAGMSTRIYGMYQFTKGPITALRHVMTPSVSITYRPDFGEAKYGYYKTIQSDTAGNTKTYSIFQNSVYGGPSNGRYANLAFSLDNNLEMKIKTNSDTGDVTRKVKLLESIRISGGYNLIADSMNLSVFNLAARTTMFDKLSLNFNSTLDPYAYDENNLDYDKYQYDVDGTLLRLTNANMSMNYSLNKTKKKENPGKYSQEEIDYINQHPEEFVDFDIPFNMSAGYTLTYTKRGALNSDVNQSLSFNGDLNLTSYWKIGFNTWYDLSAGKFTNMSLNFYRDLHCWEMRMNWIPFGGQESYNFQINVKSSILQDLKLNKRKDFYDN